MGPATASRATAESRTERLTTCEITRPCQYSPWSGPSDTRPRDGFKPTRPHSLAGMRIEPPPSLACAIGTKPAATAAAEPPLEPPVECLTFHGLWLAPYAAGSVVTDKPSSGVLVLPRQIRPAARNFSVRYESRGSIQLRRRRNCMPQCNGCPAALTSRSLSRNGTPRNGP